MRILALTFSPKYDNAPGVVATGGFKRRALGGGGRLPPLTHKKETNKMDKNSEN